MNIELSMKTKRISINVFTSINFDDIDFGKNMIFIWNNYNIVGSVVIPFDSDIYIDFYTDNGKYKSFDNYEEFRTFYYEEYKNLVK